jgi:alpha-beta hydrolase superfamily lysophospholipase
VRISGRSWKRTVGIVFLFLALMAVAGWVLLGRVPPVVRPAPSPPAQSYADAMARFDSIQAKDGPEVNPECRPRLITAGVRTAEVIVLLHGFTNCPKQFDQLAADFARLGHNVLIPRLPRHGMANRMTADLGLLTAEDMVQAGEDAIGVARGLGDHITVVGLSSSAVLAAWLALHRTDIDCAVLLAPSLAPPGIPAPAARRLTNAFRGLPNFFVWWDPKSRANLQGPRQSYPRFASHALTEVYRLGFDVDDKAGAPKAKIVLVTSAADEVVNNSLAVELVSRWSSRGTDVRIYEFPAALRVRHDMIDPEQPYQRIRITYPVIEDMVTTACREEG